MNDRVLTMKDVTIQENDLLLATENIIKLYIQGKMTEKQFKSNMESVIELTIKLNQQQ